MSKQLTILISIFAVLLSLVFFNTPDTISAEDTFWEGGISISSYGQLPRSGFYAASNAFPQDTKVKVRNPETGETVEVRVVERLEDPHMFMLVSPEAGEALSIIEGEVVNATVAPVSERGDVAAAASAQEPAYSLDPDRNPMAEIEKIDEPKDSEGLSVLRDYLDEDAPADEQPELTEAPAEELEEIVEPEIGLETSEAKEPEKSEEPEEKAEQPEPEKSEESEGPEEPEEPEQPETPRVTVIRDVEAEPESSETSFGDPDVPADPPVENGEETVEKEFPSADSITIAERPAVEIQIQDSLPRPQVREDAAERAEVLPPKEEAGEKSLAEARESAEEAEKPGWDRVEPLFARKRDTGYSPPSPVLPEVLDKEKTGPTPSMVYLESYEDGEGISYIAVEPGLPEIERGIAGIEGVRPTEREVEIAKLHTPKISEEKVSEDEDVTEERPEAAEEAAAAEEEPSAAAEEPEKRPIPEDAELVLTPAEERPPEGKPDSEFEEPDTESEDPEEKLARRTEQPEQESEPEKIAQAHFTESLTPSSYYLQLAAYQEIETAERLAGKLLPRYPVTIYEGRDETFPYKVMVGPLNEDESGVLLYSFTSRGYRDAFLRRGN